MGGALATNAPAKRAASLLQKVSAAADPDETAQALQELCSLAHAPECRSVLLAADAIQVLAELLPSDCDSRTRELAAACLSRLCLVPEGRAKAVEAGAIPHLLKLLDVDSTKEANSPESMAASAAAAALANICNSMESAQTAIVQAGGIPLLVKALQQCLPKAKTWVAGGLGNLALHNGETQTLIGEAGAVELLVDLLQQRLKSTPAGPRPAEDGALEKLKNTLACRRRATPERLSEASANANAADSSQQSHAKVAVELEPLARALGCIVYSHAGNQQRAKDAGAMPVLLQILREEAPTPQSQLQHLRTIGNLIGGAKDSAAKTSLVEADGVADLAKLLRNAPISDKAGVDSQKGASITDVSLGLLGSLAMGGVDAERLVMDPDFVPALTLMMREGTRERRRKALMALCGLVNRLVGTEQESPTAAAEKGAAAPEAEGAAPPEAAGDEVEAPGDHVNGTEAPPAVRPSTAHNIANLRLRLVQAGTMPILEKLAKPETQVEFRVIADSILGVLRWTDEDEEVDEGSPGEPEEVSGAGGQPDGEPTSG